MNHIEISEVHFVKNEIILDHMDKAIDIWFDPIAEPFDDTLLLDNSDIIYFDVVKTYKRSIFEKKYGWYSRTHNNEEFEEMMKVYLILK